MEGKELSGEEKRRKLKEEFKKDLRARKEFFEQLKEAERKGKLLNALREILPPEEVEELISDTASKPSTSLEQPDLSIPPENNPDAGRTKTLGETEIAPEN